jgi:hypothetical protein
MQKISKNANTPIICVCIFSTPITREIQYTVAAVVRTLGGVGYLDLNDYKNKATFDEALRSVIEETATKMKRSTSLNCVKSLNLNKSNLQLMRY